MDDCQLNLFAFEHFPSEVSIAQKEEPLLSANTIANETRMIKRVKNAR